MKIIRDLILIVIFGAIVFTGNWLLVGFVKPDESFGGLSSTAINVAGSRTGTSTTMVYSTGKFSSTTTYPTLIGSDVDEATYTIGVEASTSAALQLSFLASQDEQCTTASTTADSVAETSEIYWFDIGTHISSTNIPYANPLTISNGTTTLVWSGIKTKNNREITLTGLNYRCLAIQTSASSTAVWIQLKLKEYN